MAKALGNPTTCSGQKNMFGRERMEVIKRKSKTTVNMACPSNTGDSSWQTEESTSIVGRLAKLFI